MYEAGYGSHRDILFKYFFENAVRIRENRGLNTPMDAQEARDRSGTIIRIIAILHPLAQFEIAAENDNFEDLEQKIG